MTNDEVDALIINLPGNGNTINLTNRQNSTATASLKQMNDGYFISLEKYPEILYLIIHGEDNITGVKNNGNTLPELKENELISLPPGWYRDEKMKRVVIRMPRGSSNEIELLR